MLNEVRVVGYLGADPEARGQNGSVVAFSVASTYEAKGGEKKTEWIRIVTFEGTADFCRKYLKKGSLVLVSGRMQTRSYEKDGQKRYSTEVVANRVLGLDRPEGSGQSQAKPAPDDDIPF